MLKKLLTIKEKKIKLRRWKYKYMYKKSDRNTGREAISEVY